MYVPIILFDSLNIIVILCAIYLGLIKIHTVKQTYTGHFCRFLCVFYQVLVTKMWTSYIKRDTFHVLLPYANKQVLGT